MYRTCKCLLVVVFAFMFTGGLAAQDSLYTEQASIIKGFPADLDSLKVDSFFVREGVDLSKAVNKELYYEVFRWYRTCYRYGGNSNKGIDCSHFVNMLFEKFYGQRLNSSSGAIYEQCKPLKNGYAEAREGDLVFFRIKKKRVSHIALYLQNGKFAHATTQAGVIISDKDEAYYKRHFYKVGRIE